MKLGGSKGSDIGDIKLKGREMLLCKELDRPSRGRSSACKEIVVTKDLYLGPKPPKV